MYFQIEKLIVWPCGSGVKPRVVEFALGKMNLITGASKTGKSSIIPIIDYCLGAAKCTVPTGVIRENSQWYGVLVSLGDSKLLLARRDPGQQDVSNDFYVAHGKIIDIPENAPESNIGSAAVKEYLNGIAGLTNISFDLYKTGRPEKARASFRDLMAFTCLPQNIVANPNALFYKADSSEHKEKLKNVMDYVLGAVTPEVLLKQHRLEYLRAELKKKEREFAVLSQVSERWISQLHGFVARGIELGLIDDEASKYSFDEMINALKAAKERSPSAVFNPEAVRGNAKAFSELRDREREISDRIMVLKGRLASMEDAEGALQRHRESLMIRRGRLKFSEWVDKRYLEVAKGQDGGDAFKKRFVDPLVESLRMVEVEGVEQEFVVGVFERERARVREDLDFAHNEMISISQEKFRIDPGSELYGFDEAAGQRFIGEASYAIRNFEEMTGDHGLQSEIEALNREISMIEDLIRENNVVGRRKAALKKISVLASLWVKELDNERPEDPIEFDEKELTVKVVGDVKSDFLWEIGSGANWVSYHVAMTLGFQQFFMGQNKSPVPQYLIYDQPSQVYFPRRVVGRDGDDPVLKDEDVGAVKAIFSAFNGAVSDAKGKLQIIVLDHASSDYLDELSHGHLVEEWRDGAKLIPMEWLI